MTDPATDRYTLRHTDNGQHIDVVHWDAGPGTGALVRVPVRSGRHRVAADTAALVCRLLNDHARAIHQEES